MKPIMSSDPEGKDPSASAAKLATRNTLWTCLETGLRLLHPFMPFVSEELWQRLPKRPDQASIPSIMLADYPADNKPRSNPSLESDFDYLTTVIQKVRCMRSDYGLVKQKPKVLISATDASRHAVLSSLSSEAATLTTSSEVEVLPPGSPAPPGCSVGIVDDSTTVYLVMAGILDPVLEVQKLEKKVAEAEGRIEQLKSKIALPAYAKTPQAVREEDEDRLKKAQAEKSAALNAIAEFQSLKC